MEPVIVLDGVRVFHGDCVEVLKTFPDNSFDAVVTDPPYGLGFMGKEWDSFAGKSGISDEVRARQQEKWGTKFGASAKPAKPTDGEMLAFQLWCTEWATECLRVLKPGGHLLAFGGTRTWHRLAVAVEDAGFEVRDSIAWMYGSGFPKSLDVSKAIDKAANAERVVVGKRVFADGTSPRATAKNFGVGELGDVRSGTHGNITAPATPEAEQWQGWGTALKPAFEPIVVARKTLSGTVAETVLEWGTGGLNIDGSRIGTNPGYKYRADKNGTTFHGEHENRNLRTAEKAGKDFLESTQGRWPANVILDEVTAGLLDEQSGVSKSPVSYARTTDVRGSIYRDGIGAVGAGEISNGFGDSGGASRFFYCAKASKRDRNEGLEELETRSAADTVEREEGSPGMESPRAGAGRTSGAKNFHPTVKPTALMRYLVKLVTPPGGTVLDPFTGSGSTGKAAILEGFDFVGVELTEDYLPIIEGRLKWALENQDEGTLF